MGENALRRRARSALYGVVLLMAAVAYYFLVRALHRRAGPGGDDPRTVMANGSEGEGRRRHFYAVATCSLRSSRAASVLLYLFVAAIWIVPDPRIERRINA